MKVLIVDCYDSFTFNIYQQVGGMGETPIVVTNDTPLSRVRDLDCERIILSPGPGRPEDSGLCLEILRTLSHRIPTLGVCLGHQAICHAYGGSVVRAERIMHGKVSRIIHDGTGIFRGVSNPLLATRYHSLIADAESLPRDLRVTAHSSEEGYVMGVQHHTYPVQGIQFHPESILTLEGDRIMKNFLTPEVGV
jgi:anthranilate synthase/aminodeoxychorismate synthase-like glutamine amidotransferase